MVVHDEIVDLQNNNWTVTWATGKFRVNRKAGTLDGSHLAGYGPGWPGLIGADTGECIETADEGEVDHGPVTIPGTGFHYAIDGTVTDTGFELRLTSPGAKISVDAPDDPSCQFLAQLAEGFINSFIEGPSPVDFDGSRPDERDHLRVGRQPSSISATITRVAPAA